MLEAVYALLFERARELMQDQPAGHTLQATALVNEVYLKLVGRPDSYWTDSGHLLLTAARAMRQVLVDHARRKGATKRGGEFQRHPLDGVVVAYEERSDDLEALDRALEELAEFSPEMARVVELRFFAGQSMREIAGILGISPRTLDRKWDATRAWLESALR